MGASISVLIAQTLSLLVAGEFMRQLGGALIKGETTAFVDDIFCSFDLRDRTVGCAEKLVTEAMINTVRKLNVTLKIFQVCTNPAGFVRALLSSPTGTLSKICRNTDGY